MIEHFPIGLRAERTFVVTAEMIDRFALESGDRSPLHVDAAFARTCGFDDRVAHGLLLGSLVSAVLGMELPGARGVLQEIALSFHKPCYPGDRVTVSVTVDEVHEALAAITCRIEVRSQERGLLARGRSRSGVGDSA